MSLQIAAQHMASRGRGPDTALVHMAPSEVAGLQALAMKHGGSLTINPDTGLPEAGFLSSILPMVIGAGITAATGGAAAPWMIGLGVGGLQAARTGSLEKGLMAGLGAYGGAGLAGGFMGADALAAGAGAQVPLGAVVPEAALPAATATAPASLVPAASTVSAAPAGYGGFAPTETVYGAFGETPINAASQVATTTAPTAVATPLEAAAGPIPTQSPTGDFARFDRSLTPNVAATPTVGQFLSANKYPLGAMGLSALMGMEPKALNAPKEDEGLIRPYTYSREKIPSAFEDVAGDPYSSKERRYFTDSYTAGKPYKAPGPEYMAAGGPVEEMSNANAIGANTGYPQADIRTGAYSNPFQQPMGQNVVTGAQDAAVDPYTGQQQFASGGSVGGYTYDQATGQYTGGRSLGDDAPKNALSRFASGFINRIRDQADLSPLAQYEGGSIGGYTYDPATQSFTRAAPIPVESAEPIVSSVSTDDSMRDSGGRANGGLLALAQGGISNLGSYSDGGRLLRGPGDGVSDSIPAMIGQKQQARLADGEFVVPARIVSELGNGSTEAGARQLYAMMDRVQKNRKKSMGKGKVAADSKSSKLLPA